MATLFRHAWAPVLLTPCRISVATRRGIRGLRRKPLRVLPSLAEVQETQRIVPSKVKAAYIPKQPPKERQPEPEREEAELRYERAGPTEKRLRNLVTLAKSRVFREKHGRILLEGRRLIVDALEAGAVPQMIFFSLMETLKLLPAAKLKRATLVKVRYDEIKMWSDVITPQGLIAYCGCQQPVQLVANPIREEADVEMRQWPVQLAPESDSEEAGEDSVPGAEVQPGSSGPPAPHSCEEKEEEEPILNVWARRAAKRQEWLLRRKSPWE